MLRRFAVDQRGVVAVIMAFTLPVLIGFVGLGFDVGFWYLSKQNMQGAADAAAASAAAALSAGNNTGYVTEAKAVAAQRGVVDGQNGVTVAVAFPYEEVTTPTPCPTGNNYCLQVVIQKNNEPAMLSSVFGQANFAIGARSVAQVAHQTYCMLALNQGNVTGIDLTLFFSLLNMSHCSIGSNATGSSSIELQGFLVGLNAYTATAAGAFNNTCIFCSVNWTHPIKTNAGAPFTPIADPYASVTVPTLATVSNLSIPTQTIPTQPGTCRNQVTTTQTISSTGNNCYKGLIAGPGVNITFNAGNYQIYGNGITVSGGTLTLHAGNYQIYGNGITISGGGLTTPDANYTYTIVANTGQTAISVSGGAVTLTVGSGTTYIQGASGKPAINMTGGKLTTSGSASSVIDVLGGSSNPAVNMTAGTLTMNGSPTSINNILGGSGKPAIVISSNSNNSSACTANAAASPAPCFALGNGNSNIQAASGSGQPAIQLLGTGSNVGNANFTTVDNTNSPGVVIGPPSPTTYAIQVNTFNGACLLGFINCTGHDLTLGAGTYQIMGGIEVTGGNVTLNPSGTSVGTYIIDGGGGTCSGNGTNVGLCQTFGDLNGQNATIVLTGAGSNYATAYTQGADGLNLTAPQTGPTAGLAVFQCSTGSRPCQTSSGTNTTVGLNFLTVTGALYFPTQALNFLGVTALVNNQPANGNNCLQLIADTMSVTGLAYMDNQCPAGVSPIVGIGTGLAQLVE